MPANYIGNSIAAQAPSPAPSLGLTTGGDPIGAMPTDGDTLNVSSVLQALKVPLDWIAFLRRQVLASGVTLWNSANTYSALTMVLSPGDGYTYRVKAGHTSSVGVDPASPGGATDWEQWALTSEQVDDMLPVATGEVSDTGIAVAGVGTLLTGSGLSSAVGFSTVIKRVSFCLAIGATGTATVTLSDVKAFTSGVKNIQVTPRNGLTLATDIVAGITSANVINVQATVGGGGGDVFVTLEGV